MLILCGMRATNKFAREMVARNCWGKVFLAAAAVMAWLAWIELALLR
jgi:hypothetical protein